MAAHSPFVEVADRVYVARYRQWDVNVGLVLGRDGAVVVDTRASALQGGEVVAAVRALSRDLRVTHVVNTHVHFDHTFGNVAFAGATIHAHDRVGQELEREAERVRREIAHDPGDAPELGYTAGDLQQVLTTRLRPPDHTFASNATIDLGDRVVTLRWAGRGHTDGDIAVRVPDADALFLGDLVEESAHPSLGDDCWPLEWADTLASHLTWIGTDTVVIPGHERLAGMDLADAQRTPDNRLPYPLAELEHAAARVWQQLDPDGPTPSQLE